MGSSDAVAFLEGEYYVLFAVRDAADYALEVRRSTARRRSRTGSSTPSVSCTKPSWAGPPPYVLALRDLPGEYSFATLFSQRLAIRVRLVRDGAPVAETRRRWRSTTSRRWARSTSASSSAARRARHRAAGARPLARLPPVVPRAPHRRGQGRALHPRAGRRHRAQAHNLTDPRWLLRVGLYLEFLTCLGIFEAVGRRRRPAHARRARGLRDRPGVRADPRRVNVPGVARGLGAAGDRASAAARAPARSRFAT